MALAKCRECGHEISTEAKTCPNCGAPRPTKNPKNGLAAGIVLLMILGGVIYTAANRGTKSTSDAAAALTPPPAPDCKTDWTLCKDNADLANNYNGWIDAAVDCERSAKDRAKYGSPKFPWVSFGSFRPGKDFVSTGIVTAIEPDAQFQNGFGAMAHYRVVCAYDIRTKAVLSIEMSPR